MLGRENTGAALGSGAVDAEFWALVCEDEEWLQAEFDAIVSEPGETPVRPSGRPSKTAAARPGRAAWQRRTSGTCRPWRAGANRAGGGGGNDLLRRRSGPSTGESSEQKGW